jgi:hypothetical protein
MTKTGCLIAVYFDSNSFEILNSMARRAAILSGITSINITNRLRQDRKSGIPLIAVKENTHPWQHVRPF